MKETCNQQQDFSTDKIVVVDVNEMEDHPSSEGFSVVELLHGLDSFFAIVAPVVITMATTAFVVCHTVDDVTKQSMEAYLLFSNIEGSDSSNVEKLGLSLLNGLVIIGGITVATIFIILLYKYNCMCFLKGYLFLACLSLLGWTGGLMALQFTDDLGIVVDWISWVYMMWNFSVVGSVAIMYQKGIYMWINQAYLVIISVIMGWMFSQWPAWSTWAILFCLALYDMFSVLTSCGPLKILVALMMKEKRQMPGLLYEADIQHSSSKKNDLSLQQDKSQDHMMTSHEKQLSSEDLIQKEELKQQLIRFYKKEAPTEVWRADRVATLFLHRQDELWPMIRKKYSIQQENEKKSNTIKLGLGDFVFYSVLVSRAAQTGFSTFCSCFLMVIFGLALTLLALAILKQPLPALPISVILAMIFFFLTDCLFIPFIDFISEKGVVL